MAATLREPQSLEAEIADLEQRLHSAKARLHGAASVAAQGEEGQEEKEEEEKKNEEEEAAGHAQGVVDSDRMWPTALHALLLLSDSALPLGSFAFSSGLESYLAHHKPSATAPTGSQLPAFHTFLRLSLSTLASTALPYVLAGHRRPQDVTALDNDLDASTPCTVARRASIAQGRALLAVWDRSFQAQYGAAGTAGSRGEGEREQGKEEEEEEEEKEGEGVTDSTGSSGTAAAAAASLKAFALALRSSDHLNAHLAPLWGLVTRILAVPLRDAAYLFLFSHARTVISAAVRASVMGPYQAQSVLASPELQQRIRVLVHEQWHTTVQDAGQSVPVMDLWVGRHEKLYSRIFNS